MSARAFGRGARLVFMESSVTCVIRFSPRLLEAMGAYHPAIGRGIDDPSTDVTKSLERNPSLLDAALNSSGVA